MSRRDPRKALMLSLPDPLRRSLVEMSGQARLPLAYLTRNALRQALDAGLGWDRDVQPGTARPILLQLSPDERARLDMWLGSRDVSAEVAVLSLIARYLEERSRA